MKFFRSEQIKEIDAYTINHEPIASIDLMERAAGELFKWISDKFSQSDRILIFAGPGNNGGDGLALGRMLINRRYNVEIYYVKFTENTSKDFELNCLRLVKENNAVLLNLTSSGQFPVISEGDLIIDALFGTGLSRPVEGLPAEVINLLNLSGATVISIDIPSGLSGEDNTLNNYSNIVKADYTLSFQFPKLSFMFPENDQNVGVLVILPIGLKSEVIRSTKSQYTYLEIGDIFPLIKKRNRFDHKGTFGHGLLISGSYGKTGAAVLGARAALRTGIGLVTCQIPSCGTSIVQCSVPEAMVKADKSENILSEIVNTEPYDAIGVGPGIGTEPETRNAFLSLLTECKKPMVIDADGLNILSLNKEWLSLLPAGTVLTPHLKEFERLAGASGNGYTRLGKQVEFSILYNCIVVLKGANTSVTTPEGKVFFNSTGNPGMATGGSGDVLTGMILSLLAQGYFPEDAAVIGVYLHGLAGDIAAKELCFESIIASDIINNIAKAFNYIRELNF